MTFFQDLGIGSKPCLCFPVGIWHEPGLDQVGCAQEAIDLFDQAQLAQVIKVCKEARSLAEAGRNLFAASRLKRKSVNDSDRLRKYLGRFSLDPKDIMR